jgi:hypothetical protein
MLGQAAIASAPITVLRVLVINYLSFPKKICPGRCFLLIATGEYIISPLAQDRTCLKDFPKATTVRAF